MRRFEICDGADGETSVLRRFSRVPRRMSTGSGRKAESRVSAVAAVAGGCGEGDSVSLGLGLGVRPGFTMGQS